jgi:anion-transporting  ArsA/GET3 family ATPase
MDLDELVRARDVVICVGSGGVGKTTMSAAIALRAAQSGRTACVLTIDPARRLADAMGLGGVGNVATRVDDARYDAAGLGRPSGQLFVAMLDAKRTWDDLVSRFATSPEQAARILDNHYYQQISSALAGSQEFMAMEKLFELRESGRYDLVVLDTPPTRHALDFLDAPRKMMGFMDEGVRNLFATSSKMAGKLGFGLLRHSGVWMLKVLQRMTGMDVLSDISDFIESFGGMHAGFRDRAQAVEALLRASQSVFVLVTSPDPLIMDEAQYFRGRLADHGMPLGACVVNRVHTDWLADPGARQAWPRVLADAARLMDTFGPSIDVDLARRLTDHLASVQSVADRDRAHLARFQAACPDVPLWRTVPAFDGGVPDLSGLSRINEHLFPPAPTFV